MKKLILFYSIPFFILGCSPNYDVVFTEYKSLRPEWLKKGLLEDYKAQEKNYSLLFFTGGFDKQNTQIINKKDTLYNGNLKTGSMGLAEVLKINNTEPLKIIISDTILKLKIKNMMDYKFIYLSKDYKGKYPYTVTYSNTPRNFR